MVGTHSTGFRTIVHGYTPLLCRFVLSLSNRQALWFAPKQFLHPTFGLLISLIKRPASAVNLINFRSSKKILFNKSLNDLIYIRLAQGGPSVSSKSNLSILQISLVL